jgi:hypothetical protein
MIDTFLITIPKDTLIYRVKNDKNELIGNWFAYDKEDALSYGSIHSFRPLNISNRHIFKKLNPENGLNKVVI